LLNCILKFQVTEGHKYFPQGPHTAGGPIISYSFYHMLGVRVFIREVTWAGYDFRMNSFAYQSGCVGVSFDLLPEDWSRSCRRNVVSNLYLDQPRGLVVSGFYY
jgi:hypothetical protein